ncbi:ATP-binding protein [Glaciihabitans sp. dw_435]|uniref:ATP-binding protein n=1 Tax=Glaciihabitans sp. dw_435 TaxID=2720081 RepID=UPI001BD1D0BC|nr:ATP-binding protein [Glaciihabitans sp. dw_435]
MPALQRFISTVSEGVRGSLLVFVQIPMLIGVGYVVVISSQLVLYGQYSDVVDLGIALALVSIAAAFVPWHRIDARWQITLAVADVVIIALLRGILFQQLTGLNVLVLIPVIWLAFSFRAPAVVLAAVATFVVAFYPFLQVGNWPASSASWGAAFLFPVTLTAVAIAVQIVASRGRRQRIDLLNANEELRVALAQGVESTEALRLSVAEGIEGAEKLRVAVARGIAGAERLRVSVAQGVDNRERLRVSMAEGVDGAEALRVSVAEGVDSAEALRVSVAEGVDDRERLRVSVAEGVDDRERLRVSVALGLEGAEALRVSVAEGIEGAEALRVSVAEGLEGAEALRVSVAEGIEGAEALRVSVAEGVDDRERLRVSVAEGLDGAEALRVSVAEGADSAEALRVSVAEGIVGAEALRVSVAEGIEGAEALRVSVAEGVDDREKLRVSVAEGVDDKEKLRVSLAEGIEGAEALRVSVAEGVEGAEALRQSVARGLVGAEALRVSVAEGIFSSEALRVSVASGLDAASTALAVVDTVDAGITFYDPDGVILLTNDTARALAVSGNPTPSHPSQAPLVFEDDRITPIAAIDQVFQRAARGELVSRRSYWVGVGKEQRAMMATSQYVRRASGELIGTVVATHDVTPLAEAIRSRDQFLTTVSHDLRTPLTSVIGYLELIEDTIDIAVTGIDHEFGVVQRNSKRLLELINDLLTTAEGQASLERRPFNIAELADHSLNAIRPGAAAVGITVRVPILPSIMAEVDASRIGDVLDKLLSNAVKFNKPGGEVTLTAVTVGDEVVIRISDTGTGINAEDQTHIFERFFRSPSARFGEIAGTGLGLSTAKIIVDAHRGSLSVESTVGQGTTMELRLPLRVAGTTRAKPAATSIF